MLHDAGGIPEPMDEPKEELAPPPSETGWVYGEGGEEEEPEHDEILDASAS